MNFVIIFHDQNVEFIKKIIPYGLDYKVMSLKFDGKYFSVDLLKYFFSSFRDISFSKKFNPEKGFFFNLLWQLRCIYLKSAILFLSPRGVITSIDNCSTFGWLSKHINTIPFIGIQNGFRLKHEKIGFYYHQHLFCFGEHEVQTFKNRNMHVENFYPYGSVFQNLQHYHSKKEPENELDLLIVSCWRGNIKITQNVRDSMEAMYKFDLALSKYISSHSIKAAIIYRSDTGSDDWFMPLNQKNESDYFRGIYHDKVKYIENDLKNRIVYRLLDTAKVIAASFPSTVMFEALSLNKIVAFCDFTDNHEYFFDVPSAIKYDHKSNESFNAFLDRIIFDYDKDYYKSCKNFSNYFIKNPSAKNLQKIKNEISSILN